MQNREEAMGNQSMKQCCSTDVQAKETAINHRNIENKPVEHQTADTAVRNPHDLDSMKGSILQSPKIKEQYASHENLFTRLVAHRQDHLLRHMEELDHQELDSYYDLLYDIDFELMDMMYNHLVKNPPKASMQVDKLEPIPNVLHLNDVDHGERAKLVKVGLELIAKKKLAVILMAGGQGSRLGFEKAKGMYNIGMPSNKSLFNYFADRIARVSKMASEQYDVKGANANGLVQFYIMTSEMNNSEIKQFFSENKYFDLDPKSVHFFCQQSLPALDFTGKIILEDRNKVFLAPNGNGGCLTSLTKLNLVNQMKETGITHIQIFGVDNVLAKVADPYFLGYAETKNYDITGKYVPKRDPHEPAGVFVLRNGSPHVIEYSEISKELAEQRDAEGKLVYDCANIVNVICKIDFLDRILTAKTKELASKYHVAKKMISYFDEKIKRAVTPLENNGYKFELFIHDCYQLCDQSKFGLVEAQRNEEFAPVKNAPGTKQDSPDSARTIITKLHGSWLRTAGIELEEEPTGEDTKVVEIDGSVSYEGENLQEIAATLKGQKLQLPVYIK